jgi:hypothetical protein
MIQGNGPRPHRNQSHDIVPIIAAREKNKKYDTEYGLGAASVF